MRILILFLCSYTKDVSSPTDSILLCIRCLHTRRGNLVGEIPNLFHQETLSESKIHRSPVWVYNHAHISLPAQVQQELCFHTLRHLYFKTLCTLFTCLYTMVMHSEIARCLFVIQSLSKSGFQKVRKIIFGASFCRVGNCQRAF